MQNTTESTKARLKQILRFLRASQEPETFERLARFGFCAQDLANGWQLLHTAIVASDACQGCATIEAIHKWGGYWIPCARDALATRYPRAFDQLCRDLPSQRQGECIAAVTLFIKRLEALQAKSNTCAQTRAACALLESRGLSKPVIKSAAILVAQAPRADVVRDALDERDRSLGRAWAFYQRWLHLILPRTMEGQLIRELGLNVEQYASDVQETRPRRYNFGESNSSEALQALARHGPAEFAKMETRKLSRDAINAATVRLNRPIRWVRADHEESLDESGARGLSELMLSDDSRGSKGVGKERPAIAATQKMPTSWFKKMRDIESHQQAWQKEKSQTRALPAVSASLTYSGNDATKVGLRPITDFYQDTDEPDKSTQGPEES